MFNPFTIIMVVKDDRRKSLTVTKNPKTESLHNSVKGHSVSMKPVDRRSDIAYAIVVVHSRYLQRRAWNGMNLEALKQYVPIH